MAEFGFRYIYRIRKSGQNLHAFDILVIVVFSRVAVLRRREIKGFPTI